jgi:ABC-type transport system substrate-binding protein
VEAARLTRAAAIACAAVLLAACTPARASTTFADRPLVIGIVGDPASITEDDPVGGIVWSLVSEPLVQRTATEELEPRLVTAIPSYANGDLELVEDASAPTGRLVATFHLRSGLTWQDGRPLTALDVAFAFEQDRAAPDGTPERERADRIDRVDVLDATTFRVAYRPGERWDQFALGPRALPRHLLAGATPEARARYAAAPIHAGPYRIVDRSPGRIDLQAFTGHTGGPPRIARITVASYPDRDAVLGALRSGEVDVGPWPDLDADIWSTLDRTFDGRDEVVLYTPAQAVAMLRLGPRLRQEEVRRAITLAIDRSRIARAVFGGRARIPESYLVAPLWAAASGSDPPPVDVPQAQALLAKAGYRQGTFGIMERGSDRLVVTLVVPPSTALVEAAHGIAADLAGIGIAVDVLERSNDEVERRIAQDDLDMALVIERAEDAASATDRYRGRVFPWFDVLADAALEADGRADKKELYAEAQRLWAQAAIALPIFQPLKVDVVPARLQGTRPAAHSAPLTWDAMDWRAP